VWGEAIEGGAWILARKPGAGARGESGYWCFLMG